MDEFIFLFSFKKLYLVDLLIFKKQPSREETEILDILHIASPDHIGYGRRVLWSEFYSSEYPYPWFYGSGRFLPQQKSFLRIW